MEIGVSFVIGLIMGIAAIKGIEINKEYEWHREWNTINLMPIDTDKIKIMKFDAYIKLADAQDGMKEKIETLKKAEKIANEIGDGTGLI